MGTYVQVVTGRVKKVETFGVFIAVADSLLQGLAHVSELSDDFTKDPAATFAPGQAVRAVVLRKDEAQARLSLGLKASYFVGDGDGNASGDDGAAGAQLLEAADGGDERGAAAAGGDDEEVDLEDAMAAAFEESDSDSDGDGGVGGSSADEAGDDSEEEATQRVLQAAREGVGGEGGGDEGDAAAMEAEVANAVAAAQDSSSDDDNATDAKNARAATQAGPQAAGAGSSARQTAGLPQASSTAAAAFGYASSHGCSPECCLLFRMFVALCAWRRLCSSTVSLCCRWAALTLDDAVDAAAPDATHAAAPDATPAAAPPSKRARKRAREDAATAVREAELSRLNDAAPKSADDFERLVLGSPSSSYVWIRYMAFLLSMAEVAKGRAVAERALETIDYRCADTACSAS